MKKTILLAFIFFSLLSLSVLFLEKVELIPQTNSDFKIEIENLKIFGYQDNLYRYQLNAAQAKATRSTDYLHAENILGILVSENIKITADKGTISLYSASFQENVFIELIKQNIKINSPQINYNFYANKITLPQKSTANLAEQNYLIFDKGSFDTKNHNLNFSNVLWTDSTQKINAPQAKLLLDSSQMIFQQPDWLEYKNTNGETVKIKARQLTFFIKNKNVKLKDNVRIILQDKQAFADQGFFNNKTKEIILLGNSYITEGNKKIQAKKIMIDIENYSMQAFDDIQVTFEIN